MISIIDDDPCVREATASLVRSHGLRTVNFASAEDFLASDRVADTACLILDIHLPGLSGIELQQRLRAEGRKTPVIFMTAFPDDGVQTLAFAGGATGFLRKPFSADSLTSCLDKALRAPAG